MARGIKLIAMEGTYEPTIAYSPPCPRPQIGAEVGAIGLRYADSPVLVAPDYDALVHPGHLDELRL